ncbi:hypothetical protein DKT68_09575 [Micromonospora acroterricola]|uniref:Uncharacterized protein n=1 Tax=Micromonospora acroterricola TaxID=2202421 RepID=A0A317D5N2_9ACTN|nr:hypothetical protein [Micromonospora acroterricola]PWR10211.1 hypothetical protein DKT68_09575 [Micromonospora acroterricola]
MAFRTWGRLLLTALGVSVLAGAGQLGVAYGFGIIRLTGAFTGTTVNQWPAQLVWVGWFAANAAVAGAVLTGRLARRDALPTSTGRQLAVGAAAALGATVVAPLCMQPARAAELISIDPVWAVGICAVLGAVIGAGAAIAVLLRPELGWNMAAVAGAVWVLALVSVLPSLGTVGPLPTVRLGVLEPSWLDDDVAQRLALLLLPITALLAGAATAGLARWRGQVPLVSGATGVAGPVLVAFAYLTAGPGDAVDRYQTTPYYGALIAILAGGLGAAAAALLRWPPRARTADQQAIAPSAILPPLPIGPALPGTGSADDRDTAEPTGADLARTGERRDLRPADSTGAVRTVPAHWDWPAAPASGQHGPAPAEPTTNDSDTNESDTDGSASGEPGRAVPDADQPGRRTSRRTPAASAAWLTEPTGEFAAARHQHPLSPAEEPTTPHFAGPDPASEATRPAPASTDPAPVAAHGMTGPNEATPPAPDARKASDADGPAGSSLGVTSDVTGASTSALAGRTDVGAAGPTGSPGADGSTSTPKTITTGPAQPAGEAATSNGPTRATAATASAGTGTGVAGAVSTAGAGAGKSTAGTAGRESTTTAGTKSTSTAGTADATAAGAGTTGAGTTSAGTTSAGTTSAGTTSAGTTATGTTGAGTASAAPEATAPKPRRARKPKSSPAAATSDLTDGTIPSDPVAADPVTAAGPARSSTAGRVRKTARPAKAAGNSGSSTHADVPAADIPATESDRDARPPAATPATPAATGEQAATPAAIDPSAVPTSADAVAPATERATDSDRSAAPGGSSGSLFRATGDPDGARWTPTAPAWPVTPAWTAGPQAADPEQAVPEEPTEWTPRPRHRAPLPDLSRANTWDAFTTRPTGSADQSESSTGTTGLASNDSAATGDPATPATSSSTTAPAGPDAPRSASDRAAARWRRASGTPDPTAAPSDPDTSAGQPSRTSAFPVVPEQSGVRAEADTEAPASADDAPAAPTSTDDAEQPSRRGRLGGLFRRNRSRAAEEESTDPSDAPEPLPAQDEEFVDWVAGLSKPVTDNEPEQESGRRSLRSTGRHHRE